MASQRKARIGVVGAGVWANFAHFPAVQSHSEAELVAVCQRNENKLHSTLEYWGIPHGFTDFRKMIETVSLDGLIVATPHYMHYEPAKVGLEHGLHVLVEKPMVLRTDHAQELVALAREKQRTLLVGHPLPHITQLQQVRDLFVKGVFGEVKQVSGTWASPSSILYRQGPIPPELDQELREIDPSHKRTPYNPDSYNSFEVAGGGQGQTQLAHQASLIFWLTGLRATQVFAFMNNDGCAVDAYDALAIRFDNGALGALATWGTLAFKQTPMHECRIHAERGLLIMDLIQGTVSIHWADGTTEEFPVIPPETRWPQLAPATNLIDVILGEAEPVCPGEIGLTTVQLTAAAYASVASGRPQTVG